MPIMASIELKTTAKHKNQDKEKNLAYLSLIFLFLNILLYPSKSQLVFLL